MKRHWVVNRQYRPCPDGEGRWDRAYQYILQWATTVSDSSNVSSRDASAAEMDLNHANGSVCPSLHPTTSTESDH